MSIVVKVLKQLELTQEELALLLGCSQATVSRWAKGKQPHPRHEATLGLYLQAKPLRGLRTLLRVQGPLYAHLRLLKRIHLT